LYLVFRGWCDYLRSPSSMFKYNHFRWRLLKYHLPWFWWGCYFLLSASSSYWCRSEFIIRDKFIRYFLENDMYSGRANYNILLLWCLRDLWESSLIIFFIIFPFMLGIILGGLVSLIPCLTGFLNFVLD
jgi:hypothetical protein